MPVIENVVIPYYEINSSYNHLVDNAPLSAIVTRISLVNDQVDNNTQILNSAIGTVGTLANRLSASLNDDGSLKTVAINNALHSIAEHIDGGGMVRMVDAERSKLSFIADNATSFALNVQTPSTIRMFLNETAVLQPSDSITWRTSGQNIYADTNFPATVHEHHYGLIPAHVNLITPDYTNYYVTSVATPYMEGSLRIFINGVRLNAYSTVMIPFGAPTVSYVALSYTEDTATSGVVTSGKFTLSQAISSAANIVVDFDVLYV
jgi:hypothetical protein